MNTTTKLVIVVLLVVGLAQFVPELVNTVLILVLLSMFLIQADQYARLINQLRL